MDTTECLFLSRAMSALGQKQTCAPQQAMSALAPIATSIAFFGMSAWAKSGICDAKGHVRFTPGSGHCAAHPSLHLAIGL
jgi:hypothetical protein